MKTRNKFLIVVGIIITAGIFLSSAATYITAKKQLESTAREQMERLVILIAAQSRLTLDLLKRDVQVLAELPLVHQTIAFPDNLEVVAATCRFFQATVHEGKVFQSINLVNRDGLCLASSLPDRIGLTFVRKNLALQFYFQSALAGETRISQILISEATGRPCIFLNVPVKQTGRTVAVLRATVDLAYFNENFLRFHTYTTGSNAFLFHPGIGGNVPKSGPLADTAGTASYEPPRIPFPAEQMKRDKGFITYESTAGPRLAAFLKNQDPEWFFVFERPLKEVLAPIQALGQVTLLTLVIMLVALSATVFFMAHPILARLQKCIAFVRDIGEGHLEKRLNLTGSDEIARLGRGLDAMAENLEENRRALEKAERLYRGIFENAVEGIFVTDAEGRLLNANQALAGLLGYDSPEEIIGRNVTEFYRIERRNALIATLRSRSVVTNFEILFHRRDGAPRTGVIYARAERNESGRIIRIQGILDDRTEQKAMEEERRRAAEMERLLAQSRLETLRYQINPHFLFNVLNSLDALSKTSPERITNLIQKLSRYLRSTFSATRSGFVPLREELETIESYLGLEKVRFESDLVITFRVSPMIGDIPVPELILQPLVENAVKHGMKTSTMPLSIRVYGWIAGNRLRIEVANTGRWIPREDETGKRTGVGLENLRARLKLAYNERYRLDREEENGWVNVTVEIPLEDETHERVA